MSSQEFWGCLFLGVGVKGCCADYNYVGKSSEKEIGGGFRVSGRNVNLWVRVYDTEYGRRVRLTVSYNDGYRWINTPPLWMDRNLLEEFIMRLGKLSDALR